MATGAAGRRCRPSTAPRRWSRPRPRPSPACLSASPSRWPARRCSRPWAKRLVGRWEERPGGGRRWLLALEAPGAVNLNFELRPFRLPYGARLWIADGEGRQVLGPYTDADNPESGAFWTPILDGERALFLLELPPQAGRLEFAIAGIQRGFRDPFAAKAGSCNIDVVCPEGNDWRNEIRAVASYTIGGSGLCSGTLMATTNPGENRVFSTANHCVSSASQAASVVLYWRHEHPTCRPVNSSENGLGSIGPNNPNAIPQTGGAALLANHPDSDFTLLRLNTTPPAAANVFLSGWDRRANPRTDGATGIHHPQGHEKRISHTQQTLVRQDQPTANLGQRHWRVPFWNQGTTEPGSSGSGLWNRDKRLIGVLSGGSASCGNPGGFDIYGRLETAWEGGGSASSRMRDHLDPAGTGAEFLGGGGCPAPGLNLEVLTATPRAGQPVTLRASASGGAGAPYTFEWDVDGDGQIDRRGSQAEIAPLYPQATSTQIRVFVRDAAGCTALASRALDVAGPRLDFSVGSVSQLCGDGDGIFDPGERFRVPITVTNVGGGPIGAGRLLFQALAGQRTSGGPDGFGYTYADQNDGALCPFQFVDISDGARLAVSPAGSVPAEDDGRAGPVALNFPFDFYGANVGSVVMSTNGYLSTSTADTGGQFEVNCSGALSRGSVGGRIDPLQFDWLYQPGEGPTRGLFHRFFAQCPRPAQAGAANAACHVFQWNGMRAFSGDPPGSYDFQAILYQGSHQIVFQYRSTDPDQGKGAHVTIQDPQNARRLPYSCRQAGRIGPVRSVCYFHPSAQPAGGGAAVRLETPAPSLPALAPGQQAVIAVDFKLADGAACGSPIRFRMLGATDGPSFALVQGGARDHRPDRRRLRAGRRLPLRPRRAQPAAGAVRQSRALRQRLRQRAGAEPRGAGVPRRLVHRSRRPDADLVRDPGAARRQPGRGPDLSLPAGERPALPGGARDRRRGPRGLHRGGPALGVVVARRPRGSRAGLRALSLRTAGGAPHPELVPPGGVRLGHRLRRASPRRPARAGADRLPLRRGRDCALEPRRHPPGERRDHRRSAPSWCTVRAVPPLPTSSVSRWRPAASPTPSPAGRAVR
ncbi:MAG: trypsin-like peptidase domain-containing protein [Xanthomonadales bacterium]|nr:trypsin-like peptidase domain-containing protein [Xanthomonadales bacterium]